MVQYIYNIYVLCSNQQITERIHQYNSITSYSGKDSSYLILYVNQQSVNYLANQKKNSFDFVHTILS